MKKLYITIISLLIAAFAYSEDKKQSQPSEKRPQVKPDKPGKPPLQKRFPPHWGKPPEIQVRDYKPLPGGFGMGSSTLAKWIAENIKADKEGRPDRPKRPEPTEEVKKKLNAMRLLQNELHLARKTLHDNLKGKSKEEVAELIKSFRDAQKEKHQEFKEAKKELAKEIRDRVQTKERRE